MSHRTLVFLIAAILGMVALLYVGPRQLDDAESEMLFPGLKSKLNDINKVTVVGANDTTVATLERGPERWTVAEKSAYPANVAKLRRNLIGLADALIVEQKTADPSLYDRLGVEDVSQPDATGFQLNLYTAGTDDDGPTSVIIGDTGVRGDMAYVRRAGETRSLLVSADLDVSGKTGDWLASELVDIPAGRIRTVTIVQPDGESLEIENQGAGGSDFLVLDVPEGRQLVYGSVANSIGSALSLLQLDDVVPAGEIDVANQSPVVSRFETYDGLSVEVRSYGQDDDLRIAFRFTADPSPDQETRPVDAPTPEVGEGEPADQISAEEVRAQAEELEARLGPWLFSIPSYKSEQLVKRMDDLLESGNE